VVLRLCAPNTRLVALRLRARPVLRLDKFLSSRVRLVCACVRLAWLCGVDGGRISSVVLLGLLLLCGLVWSSGTLLIHVPSLLCADGLVLGAFFCQLRSGSYCAAQLVWSTDCCSAWRVGVLSARPVLRLDKFLSSRVRLVCACVRLAWLCGVDGGRISSVVLLGLLLLCGLVWSSGTLLIHVPSLLCADGLVLGAFFCQLRSGSYCAAQLVWSTGCCSAWRVGVLSAFLWLIGAFMLS
jgi:hypothetical protein